MKLRKIWAGGKGRPLRTDTDYDIDVKTYGFLK